MKKVFLSAALALAVAGSWAFYPKAPAEPSGYMQIIAAFVVGKGQIVRISPEGQVSVVDIKEPGMMQAKGKTLIELNQLRQSGWRVVQMTARAPSPNTLEETYLLEKQ